MDAKEIIRQLGSWRDKNPDSRSIFAIATESSSGDEPNNEITSIAGKIGEIHDALAEAIVQNPSVSLPIILTMSVHSSLVRILELGKYDAALEIIMHLKPIFKEINLIEEDLKEAAIQKKKGNTRDVSRFNVN